MSILAEYWDRFQSSLFPRLEIALDEPLTEKLQQFVRVLDIVRISSSLPVRTINGWEEERWIVAR